MEGTEPGTKSPGHQAGYMPENKIVVRILILKFTMESILNEELLSLSSVFLAVY